VTLLLVLLAEHFVVSVSQMSGDVQASGCHGHMLIAWHDATGVAAAVDGKIVNVSPSTRGTPAVACGQDSWLVVWPTEEFGVDGRRVALDGTLLAPIPIFRGPFGASEVAAGYWVAQHGPQTCVDVAEVRMDVRFAVNGRHLASCQDHARTLPVL
jgi:hypothetical protein